MTTDLERRLRTALAQRPPRRLTIEGARRAAVLLPVVGGPEPSLVLTLRTNTLRSHRGQISFPGGSVDPTDATLEAAALREAEEELGLDRSHVRLVGELDSIATFVSNYVVAPVVGWLDRLPKLDPNPAEVARVLRVPLDQLSDTIRAEPGFTHRGRTYPTEAWVWHDQVIWGVTAHILRLFLTLLADAGLAERPGAPAVAWPAVAEP